MTKRISNNTSTYVSDIVEVEALAWIAQLNGDGVTEKDLLAFREWVGRSPAHEKEIWDLSKLWGGLNILTTMDEPIRQADKVTKNLRRNAQRKVLRSKLAVSGLVLASVIAVVFATINLRTAPMNKPDIFAHISVPIVFKTAIGEQQKHTLSDGSEVTLNTNSHIEIDFSTEQRNVRLLEGEALFFVAHDINRPFLVFAHDSMVRAVGTKFSVRVLEQGIDVIVSEGSVELSTLSPAQATSTQNRNNKQKTTKVASLGIITAGQSAKIENAKASVALRSAEEINAKHSWQNGNLTFAGEQLEYVVSEVGRYTNLKIIIDDPVLKNRNFGGVLKIGKTEQLFRVLEAQYGIKAIPVGENTVRLVSIN